MGIGVTSYSSPLAHSSPGRPNTPTSDVNLHLVGVILLVVGAAGRLLSLVFWSSWGGVGGRRKETISDERA